MEDTEQTIIQDPLDEFPHEIREEVEGLIYLGHLEDQFEFCGHTFSIRTLKTGEELLASQIAKEYLDTIGANRAWMAAQIGLALNAVDFDEDFCPRTGPDPKSYARARFQYVTQNWYTPTIEFIFGKYAQLLTRQIAAIEALANLSERNLPPSTPLPDSLIDKDIFKEQMLGATQTSQP